MSSTWLDVITDALIEIGAFDPLDAIPAEITQLAVRKLNRLTDEWAARKVYAYATAFSQYTLTPNHQPHLIGPGLTSPDFAMARRPVRLESASLILTNSTPSTDLPLYVRDDAWWAANRTKSITSSIPTDLYYSSDYPNGSLFFWPIPKVAYGVRLETWSVQSSVPVDGSGNALLTSTFVGAPGYEKALLLTLAEELVTPLGRPMPRELVIKAAKARTTVQSNNSESPRIQSADYGTQGRGRGGFNWLSGMPK